MERSEETTQPGIGSPAAAETQARAVPGETTPLPSPPRPRGGAGSIALLFVAVAAGAFLVGITVATATRHEPSDALVARASIGPSGGILRFEGGELRVPAGTVDQPTAFGVRRSISQDRVTVRGGDDDMVFEPGGLVAYGFEPRQVTFRTPVEITFRLPQGARNGTVFVVSGGTVILLEGRVDPARGTATIDVTDFRFGGTS